jgi:hypothetical protein
VSTLCLCASRVCHVFNVFSTLCRCASCGRRLRDDVPRTARETCVQRGFADAIHDHNPISQKRWSQHTRSERERGGEKGKEVEEHAQCFLLLLFIPTPNTS